MSDSDRDQSLGDLGKRIRGLGHRVKLFELQVFALPAEDALPQNRTTMVSELRFKTCSARVEENARSADPGA